MRIESARSAANSAGRCRTCASPLRCRHSRTSEARTPVSRRRPLSPTGAGRAEVRRKLRTAPRLAPAHVMQSTTFLEVEDWTRRVDYFFFRRFVLRAPFFAADFVFVFRFFAMLPS